MKELDKMSLYVTGTVMKNRLLVEVKTNKNLKNNQGYGAWRLCIISLRI